jgi:hypothetical protein
MQNCQKVIFMDTMGFEGGMRGSLAMNDVQEWKC